MLRFIALLSPKCAARKLQTLSPRRAPVHPSSLQALARCMVGPCGINSKIVSDLLFRQRPGGLLCSPCWAKCEKLEPETRRARVRTYTTELFVSLLGLCPTPDGQVQGKGRRLVREPAFGADEAQSGWLFEYVGLRVQSLSFIGACKTGLLWVHQARNFGSRVPVSFGVAAGFRDAHLAVWQNLGFYL